VGEKCGHGAPTYNYFSGRTDDGRARESKREREGERGGGGGGGIKVGRGGGLCVFVWGKQCRHGITTCNDFSGRTDDGKGRESKREHERMSKIKSEREGG